LQHLLVKLLMFGLWASCLPRNYLYSTPDVATAKNCHSWFN